MEKQDKRERMDFSTEKKGVKVFGLMILIFLVSALLNATIGFIVVKNILSSQISLILISIAGGLYISLLIPLLLWIFILYKERKGKITKFQRLLKTASKIMFFIVLVLKVYSLF